MPTTQSLSNRSPARSKSASVQSSTSIPTFRRLPPHNWTLNPVDGDIGNHAFVERDFLDLAWHLGVLGVRRLPRSKGRVLDPLKSVRLARMI